MKAEEILEGNKLIAKFMEYSKHPITDSLARTLYQHWNGLMPVVREIGKYRLVYPEECKNVCGCSIMVDIVPLYEAVVKFIQWYNQQPKTI